MILQSLVGYYEYLAQQGKVSNPGWCMAKVSYAIDLRQDGTIREILDLREERQMGKKKVLQSPLLCVPEMATRSSGIRANFLCDNAKYFLGFDSNGVSKRTIDCYNAAKEKHLYLLREIEGLAAEAIYNFFENWSPEQSLENSIIQKYWDALNEGGNIVFYIGRDYAQDDNYIKRKWNEYINQEKEGVIGRCLVTGEETKIARIHKVIKGVSGAKSSGAALISFNAPAFESYGKEQSYNAPVGEYAEYAYTTALNYLLGQRDYKIQLGDSMIVFWAKSGDRKYQEDFFLSVDPPKDNQEEIKVLFSSIQHQQSVDVDNLDLDMSQEFYVLCLAPNAARLSVRFFYRDEFGNILKNIQRHHEYLKIVKPAWEERQYFGIRDMLRETVNQKSKDKNPISNMSAMTLRAILSGERYPESLYSSILIRIRSEQGKVTWIRAAIIKAFLIKNYKWKEGEDYMAINEGSTDSSYVLGRLFSVLEAIQREANPGIKATIRDRYFNSACATPASVFPVLIKLKNSHIKKLERESLRSKNYYETEIAKLLTKLNGFPKKLNLEEQGKFILGYYHQTQKKYEKKEDK
ncbi:MAG: type I-C CRISPR-associated protein Cas8c/Csd1 [Clostridium sp. 44_14]|jgi:CRISPR-associated protein Csd1|nr:MAG: type I-C CRISPR-associated protein Cas8c/Csd1 [Clostridium sp. 44_14]